jgi:hypothetical protein
MGASVYIAGGNMGAFASIYVECFLSNFPVWPENFKLI